MARLLEIRREFASLFRDGAYAPLHFEGEDAARLVGFARSHKRQRLLIIVGRHFSSMTDGGRHWPRGFDVQVKDESLGNYRNLLGNRSAGTGLLPVIVLAR